MRVARIPETLTLSLGVLTAILLAVLHLDNTATRGSGLVRPKRPVQDQYATTPSAGVDAEQDLKLWFWHPGGPGWDGLLLAPATPPVPVPVPVPVPSAEWSVACSCWNATATSDCCQRAVLTAHKMGHVFLSNHFRPYNDVRREKNFNDPALRPPFPAAATAITSSGSGGHTAAYRHVALVRNVRSALVSGYLYHKSGRECWLDALGNPVRRTKWKALARGWEATLLHHSSSSTVSETAGLPATAIPPSTLHNWDAAQKLHPFPAVSNRSLCQYLVDESETDGLQLYMGFILTGNYEGMVPYLESVRAHLNGLTVSTSSSEEKEHDEGYRHHHSVTIRRNEARSGTLFVCLEDASNPVHEAEAMDAMLRWLYPGGHVSHTISATALPPPPQAAEGHRSDHSDVEGRKRLLDLVRRLDRDVFDGAVAHLNGYLDCVETVRR